MIPAPLLSLLKNPCVAFIAVLAVVVVVYQFRLAAAQHEYDTAQLEIAALKNDIAGYVVAIERQAALTRDLSKTAEHTNALASTAAKAKLAEKRAAPPITTINKEVLTEWVRVLVSDL